jgi:hypothetical protein
MMGGKGVLQLDGFSRLSAHANGNVSSHEIAATPANRSLYGQHVRITRIARSGT